MNHEIQQQLVRRVLAHLERRTTDAADASTTVPIAAYNDDTRHQQEVAALYRGLPVAIGHSSQLGAPGEFLTHDATGVPLLVVRGDDGKVAAFLNVCRHRGTRVEPAPCGARTAFVCPYHAWSYGRDGSLIGVPHERGFGGLDRSTRGLVRVPAGEHAGLVFVRASPLQPGESPVLPAAEWLGAVAPDLEGFGLPTSHVFAPFSMTKELSWKLAIDVFLEAYHVRTAHKDTIYRLFFDNVGLVDPIGPHLRNVFPKRTIRDLATRPESEWELRRHANLLFHIFPNTLLLVEPDHTAVLHVWPLGPARSLMTSYTLVPEPPTTDKARSYWEANNAILHNAIAEDFALGESIQSGISSGANRDVMFGAFEHALAHFHREIERRLAG